MSHVSHEDGPKLGRPPHRPPLTLRERIEDAILRHFGADKIKPETRFVEDLGADSLDVVELAIELEEEFSLPEVDDGLVDKWVFVKDVTDYIEKRVK